MCSVSYLESGEVNRAVNLWVLRKDLIEGLLVGDIGGVEMRAATADGLDAVDGHLGGVVEVIDNDYIVAMLQQSEGGEGTDVAGSSGQIGSSALRSEGNGAYGDRGGGA